MPLDRELLQPGDHVERDRHPAVADAGDEQPVDGAVVAACDVGVDLLLGPFDLVGGEVRAAGEARHVEDQRHRAVAEQGGAGVHADVLEPGGQRLDHDLLGVEHAVDDQAEPAALGLQHGDVDVAVGASPWSGRPRASRSRCTSGSSLPRSR